MTEQPQLHSSIIAMVSLASGIASRHPDMGLCQLERLRKAGEPEYQIETVIEIARHIREEASQKLDAIFDEKAELNPDKTQPGDSHACGCSATASGQSCC